MTRDQSLCHEVPVPPSPANISHLATAPEMTGSQTNAMKLYQTFYTSICRETRGVFYFGYKESPPVTQQFTCSCQSSFSVSYSPLKPSNVKVAFLSNNNSPYFYLLYSRTLQEPIYSLVLSYMNRLLKY